MPDMNMRLILPALVLFVAACDTSRKEPAPIVYTGTQPAGAAAAEPAEPAAPQAEPAPAPVAGASAEERGVVFYDGYETIRARDGDSIAAMAARVGLSPSELAAYNGLSTRYEPAEGDELVLPAREDRYRTAPEPVQVAEAPTAAPLTPGSVEAAPLPTYSPSAPERPSASGAPAPSDADEGATTAAAADGSPAQGRDGSAWSAERARAAIENGGAAPESTASAEATAPRARPAAPAPSAPEAAPEEAGEQVAVLTPPAAGSGLFVKPADAAIARGYSQTPGPDRNDGVDFATSAGDPVVAAADGTVALISNSLGGLGTIVLVRHADQYLTVYGRVDGVTVSKGDRVARGQVIARVADLQAPRNPHLHFEIRQGSQAVDPTTYF